MGDLRDEPCYATTEASRYLGVPNSTARHWAVGHTYSKRLEGKKFAPPLIKIAWEDPPTLSFWNLVEPDHGLDQARVEAALRWEHRGAAA